MQVFISALSIGQEVKWRRDYKKDEWGNGIVSSVTHTKAKTFYNVLDDYSGRIITKLDSCDVEPENGHAERVVAFECAEAISQVTNIYGFGTPDIEETGGGNLVAYINVPK